MAARIGVGVGVGVGYVDCASRPAAAAEGERELGGLEIRRTNKNNAARGGEEESREVMNNVGKLRK
jgi:hypothetical protein